MQYKSSGTTVDVKVDTCSNVSTTVTVNEIIPSTKAALNFKIPDHKSVKFYHYRRKLQRLSISAQFYIILE
ncbi:hypothetical protein IFM89_029940 [Coptis chinensis]|uniref:Uncharacterized protein n=1 Tax=Coptis chinensis TaxID=261450 RepID=A0A835LKX1_9MAGN|nr:hypothetical protein IFM89_029940 [Coptis chinensis]